MSCIKYRFVDRSHRLKHSHLSPARIVQLDKALDLKTRSCGFDSRAGQPLTNTNYLSDETLNRGRM